VEEWLTRARDALAAETGLDPATLELSAGDEGTLLELARIAAHDSGNRINAPLLCYLVGRAQGSRELDELAEAVRRSTS
jgi:Domain of unknown function (DUF6457)